MTVQIFEKELEKNSKIAIFIGGLNSDNPKGILDKAVAKYVNEGSYAEFIDSHLDNPWIRVVITNINELTFREDG
jgi:hypothetical protein